MNFRGQVANWVSGGALVRLHEAYRAGVYGEHIAKERLSELEASLNNEGWDAVLGSSGAKEFSRAGIKTIGRMARLMWLKNPLIRRGVNVQASYVFGQGVTVSTDEKAINEALQAFWDDQQNKKVLTERHALQQCDREQSLLGNTFFAFFSNLVFGDVAVRIFDCDSIETIVTNPKDKNEVWFYERHWIDVELDYATGKTKETPRISYHPDWLYNPAVKRPTLGGHPIEWNVPVYHLKTGGLSDMNFGVSEVYCQLDWAKAYTKFLENRATVAAALSRFVLKFKAKTKAGVQGVKNKLSSPVGINGRETTPAPAAGAGAVLGEGRDVEAMTVKGATINPEEGRRFLLMVACGAGLPETFYGDVSVGTLATAESLDRPTEMMMEDRRGVWTTALSNIALYVLLRSARAPKGKLHGKATIQYHGNTPQLYSGKKKIEIKVEFPPLLQPNTKERVESIDKAAKYFSTMPRLIARLMLLALGEKNVDELVKDIPAKAETIEPQTTPQTTPKTAPDGTPKATPTDPKSETD